MSSPDILDAESERDRVRKTQIKKATELVGVAVRAQMQLEEFPESVLVEVAAQREAGYRLELIKSGNQDPEVQRLEREKDLMISLLNGIEQNEAHNQATVLVDTEL